MQRPLSPAELARIQVRVEAFVKACAVPAGLAFMRILVLQRATITDELVLATAELLFDVGASFFEGHSAVGAEGRLVGRASGVFVVACVVMSINMVWYLF